ncbi:NADH:flavin oxidoreductase/NADH oxidase family protein [Moraxella ovis]|uniref:NADH:flavin oxidoreductase/NADH oxidase family protein n=1 Tax=Moraxella ovis TaxID=29433 RepID=UPI000D8B1662|nr:NADH:flavin oxidoreductase/NADH oxidase family protein [Moraxella ovis]SPX86878.1 NADH oxidase [Moraxella ovis]STZ05557.1 NADH oxidase [Moraxella ovis]
MLFDSFAFANGTVAKNRIFKSAMEEGLAKDSRPTDEHAKLYEAWARGGSGILVTGNVAVCREGKGSVGDVVVDGDGDLERLQVWSTAGSTDGTVCIMQINHAGKQVSKDVNPAPVAPSAVTLQGMDDKMNPPRALTTDEIKTIVSQFANTAKIAKQAGFGGVQIHAAHGYLISQFLSPHHNVRDDGYGGSLDGRMRFLMEVYEAVRGAVGGDFLVGVKLNSADFQKGGFEESDSIEVVKKLSEAGIDFIEISGGNYESPAMMGAKDSTKKREAFFLDYAQKVRDVSTVPLIITGGFRSQAAMNEAISSGELDFVGVGRPLIMQPDMPHQMQKGTYDTIQITPIRTGNAKIDENVGSFLELSWYMVQMKRIAHGIDPDPNLDQCSSFKGCRVLVRRS